MGQWKRIVNEPAGAPMADWAQNIPNDGIIRYLDFLNSEAIFPTSEKALGEILTTKSDEFIKPPAISIAVKSFFGSGLTFSEGEDHKVRDTSRRQNTPGADPSARVATPRDP